MRVVEIKMLPDGSGKVRIHYFVLDDAGPISTPPGYGRLLGTGGVKGRIACQPGRTSVLPEQTPVAIRLTCHTNDARGVTCPECKATKEWQEAMRELSELLDVNANAPVATPRQE